MRRRAGSPAELDAIVLEEAAVRALAVARRLRDHAAHAGDARLRIERRLRAAHVGAHPARMQRDAGRVPRLQRSDPERVVHRRLARAIEPAGRAGRLADAAHLARQHREDAAARLDARQQDRHQQHRAEHVRVHHRIEVLHADGLDARRARAVHARHDDGRVERGAAEARVERRDVVGLRDVERERERARAERIERRERRGVARRGDHAPAVMQILADEFAADAARCADDQYGLHRRAPVRCALRSDQLDAHRGRFAAADAQARHAALGPARAQRADQRDEDAGARRADRMAERARAAVHVDLLVRQAVLLHRRHRDDRERFVDLVQVDLGRAPAVLLEQAPDRADRRRRELRRRLRERRMADDARERREPEPVRRRRAHHHERGRAVGDRRRIRGGHGARLAERGLERRNLLGVRLERLLVARDHRIALLAGHRHGRDFPRERAVLVRPLRARERFDRERVLRVARERVFARAFLGERAHQPALVVGVLEAVEEHVVEHLAVAHAHAGARLRQQVRRVRHAFHAARDDHVDGARHEHVVREHRRAHARAAHLVDRRAADRQRQLRAERRLPRRRLPLPGGQHAAHHRLVDLLRLQARALERRGDRGRAQLRCGERRELALKARDRRARRRCDDDRILINSRHVSSP
ncbi:acetyl-CoA acetyltransferase domain protein [Burkholderia mallei]|nr:acetyl-CoA acetyltransferase domain protein [Burkholderia mallei]KOS96945.1 acetyl-CoA acetyltransferase domain protein [Burkholderia mallei]KOT16345.1 acetyl-CoA acetyltransferase domain protein [Burkholderia mallei]